MNRHHNFLSHLPRNVHHRIASHLPPNNKARLAVSSKATMHLANNTDALITIVRHATSRALVEVWRDLQPIVASPEHPTVTVSRQFQVRNQTIQIVAMGMHMTDPVQPTLGKKAYEYYEIIHNGKTVAIIPPRYHIALNPFTASQLKGTARWVERGVMLAADDFAKFNTEMQNKVTRVGPNRAYENLRNFVTRNLPRNLRIRNRNAAR